MDGLDNQTLQYIIEFLTAGDTGKAVEELRKLQEQGEKTSSTMEKLKSAGEKLVAFFGAELVLREALDKFIEAEQVTSKLETALRKLGDQGEETRKVVGDLVDELKEMTTFSGEAITNVVAKLISLGATKDNIRPLTEAVLDLSTLMDKDLNRATQAMGRAIKGEFSSFTELGFKIDETANSGQKLASTLEQIGKAAGGQARAAAGTLGGEMQNLQKHIDELKQSIGQLLGTGIQGVGGLVQGFEQAAVARQNAPALKQRLEFNARRREGLESQISALESQGAAGGRDRAAYLRQMLEQGFAGDEAPIPEMAGMRTRNPDTEHAAMQLVQELLKPGSTGQGGKAAPAAAGPIDIRNPEEEKAALANLQQIKREMAQDSLGDYAREKQAIQNNYEDRIKAIYDEANKARLSEEEIIGLEDKAEAAAEAQLQRLEQARADSLDRQSLREQEAAKQREDMERQLSEGKVAAQLEGEDLVKYQMTLTHEARVRAIQEESFDDEDQYARAIDLERQLYAAEQERYNKTHSFYGLLRLDLKQLAIDGEQAFAQQLSTAIVDSFEQGDKAFQKFAANFLRLIAQMILQSIILRVVQGAAGSISWGGGGGVPSNFSAGGGVYDTSGPTVLPKFDVMAGEAGRETLAVLSRPSMMSVAGVRAIVGNAGPTRMAVVPASALARMADGGMVGSVATGSTAGPDDKRSAVEVTLDPGLQARIIKQAVAGAVVEVTRQLKRDTPVAAASRRLT